MDFLHALVGSVVGNSGSASYAGDNSNLSVKKAHERISNLVGHSVTMLTKLESQNKTATDTLSSEMSRETQTKISAIYKKAHQQISSITTQLTESVLDIDTQEKINELRLLIKSSSQSLREAQTKYNQAFQQSGNKGQAQDPKISKNLIRLNNLVKEHSAELQLLKHQLKTLQDGIDLTRKVDVEELKAALKLQEKRIVKVIQSAQVGVISTIAEARFKGTQSRVTKLAKGEDRWIKLTKFLPSHREALKAFQTAKDLMVAASRKDIPLLESESEVDKAKRDEFEWHQLEVGSLAHRDGVTGIGEEYRFQVDFSEKAIKKQLHSFTVQRMSGKTWDPITKNITIGDHGSFESVLTPVNTHYDTLRGKLGATVSTFFRRLIGNKGVTSANIKEPVVPRNFWNSKLEKGGKVIFDAFRHAILTAKHQSDPTIRAQVARDTTKTLLQAALLKEIASRGLTVEQAAEQAAEGHPIILNLSSVSLVTPDALRHLLSHWLEDEREMLEDQLTALNSFKGPRVFELDGVPIHVNVNVNAFNFAVNKYGTKGWGAEYQYTHNREALEGLINTAAISRAETSTAIVALTEGVIGLADDDPKTSELTTKIAQLQKGLENREALMKDIEVLMKNKSAYLKGGNQYEIGAKILLLNNEMAAAATIINEGRPPAEQIAGSSGAFNCMSGKDRTGIMDGVAKAFAIMNAINGQYPSHQEFLDAPKGTGIRQQFAEILGQVLVEAGSLEITELNTGAKGYKVGKEAQLGVEDLAFLEAQGLGITTAS